MSTLEKHAARWDEILGRLHTSPHPYDAGRFDELRHKYAADPEPRFLDEKDAAAFDAGVPRRGPI